MSMETEKEHVKRPGEQEQEQGKDMTNTNQNETPNHEQESKGYVSKALGGPANSFLKRTSAAVRNATIEFQTKVSADACYELLALTFVKRVPSQDVADAILAELKTIEKHMHRLRRYINAQEDGNKPLYQWAAYEGFSTLNTSVSQLRKAMTKFKVTRLPSEYLRLYVERATASSTSVSRASGDILAAMRKKLDVYVDEMKASTLSDEANTEANTAITEELRKLIQYSTRATEAVWQAHDLLRACQQQGDIRSWAWSVGATALTAFIATAVSLATVYCSSSAHLDMLPAHGVGNAVCSQLVGLVQHSQAITNLTGEVYKLKFEDMDNKYDDLTAWSEAHGLRIDGIVDGLGPPNQDGMYYTSSASSSKSEKDSCETRWQKVSGTLQAQLQRQQHELENMRKTMHRLDIRLTRGIEEVRKD